MSGFFPDWSRPNTKVLFILNKCCLTTVIQFSITRTDVPVVSKNASVDGEAVGDDVLLPDPDGPPTLVVYAVQLQNRPQSQLWLDRRCS